MEKIISELEKELNELGSNWNLFGKVDKMKYLVQQLKKLLKMKFEMIDNIEFGGIVWEDAQDFSDMYVVSADYDGLPMDGDELDALNRDSQMVYELYLKYED